MPVERSPTFGMEPLRLVVAAAKTIERHDSLGETDAELVTVRQVVEDTFMKMQSTYGIYENEIDNVLDAVRSHASLSAIEAIPCPCCGARIAVEFAKEGSSFQINCSGEPPHFSMCQEICNPPPWWKERVSETRSVIFYWRENSVFAADGTLSMKVSGYDEDGSHWTGDMELLPNQPDYLLWRWILVQGDRFKTLLSDKDLEPIREEFRRNSRHT